MYAKFHLDRFTVAGSKMVTSRLTDKKIVIYVLAYLCIYTYFKRQPCYYLNQDTYKSKEKNIYFPYQLDWCFHLDCCFRYVLAFVCSNFLQLVDVEAGCCIVISEFQTQPWRYIYLILLSTFHDIVLLQLMFL